jgi:hypothetical protein
MSDALQDLIRSSEAPLSIDAIALVARLRQRAALQRVAFALPDDLLSTAPPHFDFEYILPLESAVLRTLLPWSPRLERELFSLGVHTTFPEQEALRTGTNLIHSLAYVDIRHGRDYVNAVLWEVVNDRYAMIDVVATTLFKIAHYSASRGPSYAPCRHEIEQQIDGYQNSLFLELHYPMDLAYRIVVAGLVYLLDRRHTLTIRSVMFPGSGSFSF